MRRAAIERARTVSVWRDHNRLAHGRDWSAGKVRCICDTQANRFRKGQKRLGCGRTRCMICHGEKILGKPTLKELSMRESEREQLKEIKI